MVKKLEAKAEIRERALKDRAKIPKADREAAEHAILERLVREDFYADACCVYCYSSFRDEVATTGIIEESLKRGKKAAVPKVIGRRRMEFIFIKNREDLRTGTWDIPEPGPWSADAPLPDERTMVILSVAAFDRADTRDGY